MATGALGTTSMSGTGGGLVTGVVNTVGNVVGNVLNLFGGAHHAPPMAAATNTTALPLNPGAPTPPPNPRAPTPPFNPGAPTPVPTTSNAAQSTTVPVGAVPNPVGKTAGAVAPPPTPPGLPMPPGPGVNPALGQLGQTVSQTFAPIGQAAGQVLGQVQNLAGGVLGAVQQALRPSAPPITGQPTGPTGAPVNQGLLPPGLRPPPAFTPAGQPGQAPGILTTRPLPAAVTAQMNPAMLATRAGVGDAQAINTPVRNVLLTMAREPAPMSPTGWRPAAAEGTAPTLQQTASLRGADAQTMQPPSVRTDAQTVQPPLAQANGATMRTGDAQAQQLPAHQNAATTQTSQASPQGRADGPTVNGQMVQPHTAANRPTTSSQVQHAFASLIANFRAPVTGAENARPQTADRNAAMRAADQEQRAARAENAHRPGGMSADGVRGQRSSFQRTRGFSSLTSYLLSTGNNNAGMPGTAIAALSAQAYRSIQNLLWICALLALLSVGFGVVVAWDQPPLVFVPSMLDRSLWLLAGSAVVVAAAFWLMLLYLRQRYRAAVARATRTAAALEVRQARESGAGFVLDDQHSGHGFGETAGVGARDRVAR